MLTFNFMMSLSFLFNNDVIWFHFYMVLETGLLNVTLLSLIHFSLIMILFSFTFFTHVLLASCLKIFSCIQMKGNDVEGMLFCSILGKVGEVGSYHHSLIKIRKNVFLLLLK